MTAGGDIVILKTTPETSPTNDVLVAALTERLTFEVPISPQLAEGPVPLRRVVVHRNGNLTSRI